MADKDKAKEEEKVFLSEALGRDILENNKRIIREIGESVPKIEDIVRVPADIFDKSADEADSESLIENAGPEPDSKDAEMDRAGWFPKGETTRRKWGEAWSLIKLQKDEYYKDDGTWDDPEPTIEEIKDRLHTEMNWAPKTRTIRNIKRAGTLGWLTEYEP